MNKRTIDLGKDGKWERVNKTQARNAAKRGETVLMHPCNLSPYYGLGVFRTYYTYGTSENFDEWVETWGWFNCTNSETGYYPAYYLQTA